MHHVYGNIEYDLCLVTVCGIAVHLGKFLTVSTEEKQCHSRRKFALALFLRYLDIRRVELAVAV